MNNCGAKCILMTRRAKPSNKRRSLQLSSCLFFPQKKVRLFPSGCNKVDDLAARFWLGHLLAVLCFPKVWAVGPGDSTSRPCMCVYGQGGSHIAMFVASSKLAEQKHTKHFTIACPSPCSAVAYPWSTDPRATASVPHLCTIQPVAPNPA